MLLLPQHVIYPTDYTRFARDTTKFGGIHSNHDIASMQEY